MIHQELKLLPDLSVAENVFVGRLPMRGGRIDRAAMNERAAAQLKRLGPQRLAGPEGAHPAGRRAAAGRDRQGADARTRELLILDEPTAALGGEETELLFEQIRQLKAEGMSFIYISHRLDEIARDRRPHRGDARRPHRGPPRHAPQVPVRTVVEQMVGRSVERMFPELGDRRRARCCSRSTA